MVALFVISAENPGRSRERPGFSALNHYNYYPFFSQYTIPKFYESLHSDQADRGAGNQIKRTAFHP